MTTIPYVALLKRQMSAHSPRLARYAEALQVDYGMTILHQDPTLLVLGPSHLPRLSVPHSGGLIIGHLFDRASGERVRAEPPRALDAPAERFVEDFWGGYVALRTTTMTPEVLRDPSGTIPCYHAALDDVHIVTSVPVLLFATGLLRPDPDWTIVAQALVFRDLRPARTALRGVDEILPGVAGRLFPTGFETRRIWNPWRFTAATAEIRDFDAAVDRVGRNALQCLAAWGSCFDRPLVEISGGLDSAIVAAGLAHAGCGMSALTYAAATGDPDETPYAQAVADHLGVPLHVVQPASGVIDLAHSDAASLPRPNSRNFAQAFDRAAHARALTVGADAFFSGGGGDNVFSYQRSLLPAIDRIRRLGTPVGLFETFGDLATLGQTSIWHVATRTARRLFRRGLPEWRRTEGFLTAAGLDALPFPAGHPWMAAPPDTPPGKHAHVMALIRVQNHLEGHGRLAHAQIISPLLSQPLMEACLAVPSWLWCRGGHNRAVARAAFAGLLPAPVLARQGKGAFDSFSAQLFAARRDELRALLLDGALAAQSLLDRSALEAVLCQPLPDSETIVRLWQLADVEAWARGWLVRADRHVPL